jgi:hypothetical protein
MAGACALIADAASMCVTDEVSSVGTSESSLVSLLRAESALAELPDGAAACAVLSLIEPLTTTALSDFLEHAAAESVSQSAGIVMAPSRTIFARGNKDIPE